MSKLIDALRGVGKVPALFFVILAFVPLFVKSDYLLHLVILFLMWSALGMSWNLLGGYAGQVSFGHAVFFGMGAYTAVLLFEKLGVSLWLGFIAGGVAAALIAIPIGAICFRLRGPYFSLSILAFSEVLRLLVLQWKSFTNGAVGILLLFPVLDSKIGYYYLILGFVLLIVVALSYVLQSRAGFYFIAIREDEDAAEALGIRSTRYKIIALTISAFFTGLMGCFYANYTIYVDPYIAFSIVDLSIAVVLVVVLGGIGTFYGSFIGALIVVLVTEVFRNIFAEAHMLVYGVLIIIVILFLPEGVMGGLKALSRKLTISPALYSFLKGTIKS
jgi:branched-chain amino acid transport system permease protein